jgi:hypothetical protein
LGSKESDKSNNYKNLEKKGFQNAGSEFEAKAEKPLPLTRGN